MSGLRGERRALPSPKEMPLAASAESHSPITIPDHLGIGSSDLTQRLSTALVQELAHERSRSDELQQRLEQASTAFKGQALHIRECLDGLLEGQRHAALYILRGIVNRELAIQLSLMIARWNRAKVQWHTWNAVDFVQNHWVLRSARGLCDGLFSLVLCH